MNLTLAIGFHTVRIIIRRLILPAGATVTSTFCQMIDLEEWSNLFEDIRKDEVLLAKACKFEIVSSPRRSRAIRARRHPNTDGRWRPEMVWRDGGQETL
jgi:hypothetical protein